MDDLLSVPGDLAERLRGAAAALNMPADALLRTTLEAMLPVLTGERHPPRWFLCSVLLRAEDTRTVGLDKVLPAHPRWSVAPLGPETEEDEPVTTAEAGVSPDAAQKGADEVDHGPWLALLRREDGPTVLVEYLPHAGRAVLHAELADRERQGRVTLAPQEAWTDFAASGWRKILEECDRLADGLIPTLRSHDGRG